MTKPASRVLVMLAAAAGIAGVGAPAGASEPARQKVVVSASPGTVVYKWTGEVPPGAVGYKGLAAGPCANTGEVEDIHTLDIALAGSRVYKDLDVTFTFTLQWTPESGDELTQDIEMEIYGPAGAAVGESTNAGPTETFKTQKLDEGSYNVVACPASVAVPQPYNGTLEVTGVAKAKKPTTQTTTPPAVVDNSGGGDDPGSGGAVTRQPSSVTPLPPSARRPNSVPAFGAGRLTDLVETSNVDPTEAAPTAFLGGPDAPAVGPPPVVKLLEETAGVPLAAAILVSLIGVAAGAFALMLRRRRGLDEAPGTALVPVG